MLSKWLPLLESSDKHCYLSVHLKSVDTDALEDDYG